MKNLLLILAAGAFFITSCSKEYVPVQSTNQVFTNDLQKVEYITTKTAFTAELVSSEGNPVTSAEQITPNTLYKVKIKGPSSLYYRIKFGDGFTVVDHGQSIVKTNKLNAESLTGEKVITIKTNASEESSIYMSIVPIHAREGDKLQRESPQRFLFPANY